MICHDVQKYASFSSCTLDGIDVLINDLKINHQFLTDAIGIYQKSSDSLSINQLMDCPEAVEYASMIHQLMWGSVAPLLLVVVGSYLGLKIAKKIMEV
jgi:hypothetical protein